MGMVSFAAFMFIDGWKRARGAATHDLIYIMCIMFLDASTGLHGA
jgi:hypothetical protein